ncbi:hypothetical protein CMV30_17390 [Nibricoccus aquaticus]|uniref:PAS domain-containing protein n=1 Tax=Nibricoccus aquaticus TaxID=2576891 RepID=A0A290QEC6_9BACT|nr:PAS domain-containing protein [Nibricoccus aquaticus]ATC65580.1 hypothetical protein CMV30_17390 [Nibricoccus aquaticus]
MVPDDLQNKAVQYVSGDMSAPERENFEVLLAWNTELRADVGRLSDAVGALALAEVPAGVTPSAGLKARILNSVAALAGQAGAEALVKTDAEGRIEWVNDAFTAMCGYSLDELKGRRPGAVLQGAETDSAAVGRIRDSMLAGRACRETLINYHKDGSAYRVDVRIDPILDEDGRRLCFVARERKLEMV